MYAGARPVARPVLSEWQRVLKRREHLLQQEISAMEKAGLERTGSVWP